MFRFMAQLLAVTLVLVLVGAANAQTSEDTASNVTPKTRKVALLVGVGIYNEGLGLEKLSAPRDCENLEKALRDAGWEVDRIGTGLASTNAGTRERLLSFVGIDTSSDSSPQFTSPQSKLANVKPGDVVLFYYGGHGLTTELGADCLIPENARKQSDSGAFDATSLVPLSWVRQALVRSRAKTILLVTDACRNPVPARDATTTPRFRSAAVTAASNEAIKLEAGQQVFELRSADQGQLSLELPDQKGGVFSNYLLDVLTKPDAQSVADKGRTGKVTLKDAFMYLREQTSKYSTKQGREQNPILVPETGAQEIEIVTYQRRQNNSETASNNTPLNKNEVTAISSSVRALGKQMPRVIYDNLGFIDRKKLTASFENAWAELGPSRGPMFETSDPSDLFRFCWPVHFTGFIPSIAPFGEEANNTHCNVMRLVGKDDQEQIWYGITLNEEITEVPSESSPIKDWALAVQKFLTEKFGFQGSVNIDGSSYEVSDHKSFRIDINLLARNDSQISCNMFAILYWKDGTLRERRCIGFTRKFFIASIKNNK
jgi:uncharacterized caspase-like protein